MRVLLLVRPKQLSKVPELCRTGLALGQRHMAGLLELTLTAKSDSFDQGEARQGRPVLALHRSALEA